MENKIVIRYFLDDVYNRRDLSELSAYCAGTFVCHDALSTTRNLTELRWVLESYHAAFPDLKLVIEAQIGEGDLVSTRVSCTGRDWGGFLGRPRTGKIVSLTGTHQSRLRDGRMVEAWTHMNYLGLFQQLDIVPRFDVPRMFETHQAHAR